jgi:hypothetical protein
MIFIPFSTEKCIFAYWFCATSCTLTKSKLYFEISSATAQWTCPTHTFNFPRTKSHIHFLSLRSFIQGIRLCPRLLVVFRNKVIFYSQELLAPRWWPPLVGCLRLLINIFTATLQNWRDSPPSATWGRAMPWWQGTHLMWCSHTFHV